MSILLAGYATTSTTLLDEGELDVPDHVKTVGKYAAWYCRHAIVEEDDKLKLDSRVELKDITDDYEVPLAKTILKHFGDIPPEYAVIRLSSSEPHDTIILFVEMDVPNDHQTLALDWVLQGYLDAVSAQVTEDSILHGRLQFEGGVYLCYRYRTKDRVMQVLRPDGHSGSWVVHKTIPKATLKGDGKVHTDHQHQIRWSPNDVPIEFGGAEEAK